MATARRLSYSLLISTLVFIGFTVVAFSGLFPWIEAQFYSPKVVGELQGRLDSGAAGLESWKTQTLVKLEKALGGGAFDGVFAPTASQEALQKRVQVSKLFLLGLRGGGSLRILSGDRTQIHFSTEDSDVKVRTDLSLTYRPVAEVTGLPDLQGQGFDGAAAQILFDAQGLTAHFLVPWKDSQGLLPGYAFLSVSLEDLRLFLMESGLALGNQPMVSLGSEDFLLSLLGRKTDAAVLNRVKALRNQGVLPPVQRLATADGQVSVALVHKGHLNLLVPASMLELDAVLKILLLASFYTVVFLVTFLLANLRGEPLSVVTRKVKRFQLQVVKQYLDLKEQDKIQSLRDELARHSAEIRSDVRKSLGRVRKRDQEWVDRYIDTSWQEVMDLLRGPAPPAEQASQADWKRLETLLQQALTQGRFVVSSPEGPRPSAAPAVPRPVKPVRPAAQALVAVEELEEIEDAEAVEELEEAEDAEAVEELEEAEDAEAVEELEEAEDAEAVEELEEAEDAEAVEELEEAEDAEAVEELEEAEELEGAVEGEAVPEERPRSVSPEAKTLDGRRQPAVELKQIPSSGSSPAAGAPAAEEPEELEELEELEPEEADDSEEAGALEELSPAAAAPRSYQLGPGRASGGTVTLLPSVQEEESAEELEDLEDLEELDELVEDLDEAAEAGDADSSYPLERLDAVWGATAAGVFNEADEVVSLRDELFSKVPSGDDEFGHLVDEVLAGPDGQAFEPLEEDLVPRHQVREWRWTGGGFDWDRFALGADEVNLFRALSDIVTEFDAFTAAILTERDGGWAAQSSVGFSDSGKTLLEFGPESPLNRSFLSIRALHILKGGGSHSVLRESFHVKDLKFLKSILCVPLLFRHEPAWLLLGLRHEPGDLLTLLAPRQVE